LKNLFCILLTVFEKKNPAKHRYTKSFLTFYFLLFTLCLLAQEPPASTAEQQLENLTDATESETEDDTYLQQMQEFIKHPVNLNTADAAELRELKILTDLQIQNFIVYRKLLGKLISVYELQAVPAWDILTIKKILPFISVNNTLPFTEELGKRFNTGDHSMLIRYSSVIEKAKGYNKSAAGSTYSGSRDKLFFRYRYNYKNLLQYGIAADKDAGEQFFKGKQQSGFDFYSFHLFARKVGYIESLAIGDFTVNLGQGLIQWQSLAFRKSVDVINIKRQAAVLSPYNSAGEYNFHRGAGITVKKGKMEATAFASYRKLSANFVADTINNEDFVSSFLTSGFHRTVSELDDRNRLRQIQFGGNIKYSASNWHLGINAIHYNFSLPIQKSREPYNLYAISGKTWSNYSIDYSYTYKNLYFFGEAAADKNFNTAIVNGLLISADSKVDISFFQRNISPKYQSINSNAFTENTFPVNEKGIYAGISIRPAAAWRVDAYADFFSFPWLKFLTDAPGSGNDFLTQLTYAPNKQVELYTRYRSESKQVNQTGNTTATNFLVVKPRQSWRTQFSYKINSVITLRNRIEVMWYDKKGINKSDGFLSYFDIQYKPVLKSFSGNMRLQYFETDDFNSRVYAYENDVLYYFAIPVFFDKGYRYYFNLNYDLGKRVSFWLKWSQSIFQDKTIIGSGSDEIKGNKKSELRLQAIFRL
jgi:Helix-hairpin-helix motif